MPTPAYNDIVLNPGLFSVPGIPLRPFFDPGDPRISEAADFESDAGADVEVPFEECALSRGVHVASGATAGL